jgi:predicted nucleic acid-binding protein
MAENEPVEIVCDAGPIIHLDELGCLDLLSDFGSILVPEGVWKEVVRHRPGALEQDIVQFARTSVSLPQDSKLTTLIRAFALDAGEQEALALMVQQPTAILLTDDAAARLVADQLGMRVHGTIGVLLRAIRREQRTPAQVLDLLHQLPQRSTLYIHPNLLKQIIEQVQKEYL